MRSYYLDSSIAVAALTGIEPATSWFDQATQNDSVTSSRLLQTELTRVLRRDNIPIRHRNDILDHINTVHISERILVSAEAITEHVKTLDAIHLATALYLGSETIVVSHDSNMLRMASELGLHALDPITGATA